MDRLVYWIYRLVAAVIARLPIEVVFRTGWFLGLVAWHVATPYRRLVLRNLEIAFGDEKTVAERRDLGRRHFATLGANLLSSLKLPTLSREKIRSLVTIEGRETVGEGTAAMGGVVVILSHLGNWELLAQLMPVTKGGTIYQRLGNPYLDAELRRHRARLGLALFERKEGFLAATKLLRSGGAVGVLVDQHAGDAGLWCPFFDRLASTSTLAATLALRTDASFVTVAAYTTGIARWRCVISDPIKPQIQDANAITARLNEILEAQIRQQPEDWFWVHNRWKMPRPRFLLATYKRGITIPPGFGAERTLKPFRILIRASNWLGDAVMSAPAVRAIKHGRPDAHVTILTPAKLTDFWNTVAEVDEVIGIEPADSVFNVASKIRRGFEVAIIFPNSFRTALETWLAGIPRRVGYRGHHRGPLLNQVFREKKKSRAQRPRHQVHRYLELAAFVGADLANGWASSAPVAKLREEAPADQHPVLGLCPGAEYGPAKRWLPERFAEVMQSVHQRHGCEWKLFGVAKDRGFADIIVRATEGVACTDLIGKTTLAQLIEEMRTCRLLVTNDTGTMHLAAWLDIPVVAIFGSTEPALTAPLGEGHIILRHHVECSPCFLRECPLDFRCMRSVTAAEVIDAIKTTLAGSRQHGAATMNV